MYWFFLFVEFYQKKILTLTHIRGKNIFLELNAIDPNKWLCLNCLQLTLYMIISTATLLSDFPCCPHWYSLLLMLFMYEHAICSSSQMNSSFFLDANATQPRCRQSSNICHIIKSHDVMCYNYTLLHNLGLTLLSNSHMCQFCCGHAALLNTASWLQF